MKVVIAIDSFKGSMSSKLAGEAAAKGVLKVFPKAEVIIKPVADGGEGTVEALVDGLGGQYRTISVRNPFNEPVMATYGIVEDTAIMEMAEASGITLIEKDQLDPFLANTYGTGEMIKDALDQGIRKFIMGIGGSATTEGGIGMLQALGAHFYNKGGNKLPPEFPSLSQIERIDLEEFDPRLQESTFLIACDVTNPLCGKNGAVAIFGPQKGVKRKEIESMDQQMAHYASKVNQLTRKDHTNDQGAGAAGGLGFAFLSFFPHVKLQSGVQLILDYLDFRKDLTGTDILITGEGRLDGQTAMGKVPVGIAKLAKEVSDCKTVAFAGSATEEAISCNQEGIDAFFPIIRGVCSLDEAMDPHQARKNMEDTVEQVFRLLK